MMDKDDRELVGRLFAAATARLEDAVEHAVAGQSSSLGAAQLIAEAARLREMAEEVAILAEAASITLRGSLTHTRKRRASRPRRKRSTSP